MAPRSRTTPTNKRLSNARRRAVINTLLSRSVDGVLPRGAIAAVAVEFKRDGTAIGRIWKRHQRAERAGVEGGDYTSHMKGRVGRKPLDRAPLVAKIRAVPIEDRTSKRRLAIASGVSRRLLSRLLAEGVLRKVTDNIKPLLTERHRIQRLRFVLSHLDENSMVFDDGYDVVHVDEKWFNEDKDEHVYFLLEGEVPPPRERRSKRFIPKTMFLAAVARPCYDPGRQSMFDGKIGLYPFIESYVAKRDSSARKKGTVCTRNIASVDRPVYKDFIVNKVIPDIKAKWPAQDRGRPILIQQDNARPHVPFDDPEVVAAGTSDGWNIRMMFQPPNSPDLNVLDLGFFASIQSIQYRHPVRGVENLLRVVKEAFEETSIETLDNIFLTLQAVMQCILESEGGNRYALPHMGKAALRKKGELPTALSCDAAAYEKATAYLEQAGFPMLF